MRPTRLSSPGTLANRCISSCFALAAAFFRLAAASAAFVAATYSFPYEIFIINIITIIITQNKITPTHSYRNMILILVLEEVFPIPQNNTTPIHSHQIININNHYHTPTAFIPDYLTLDITEKHKTPTYYSYPSKSISQNNTTPRARAKRYHAKKRRKINTHRHIFTNTPNKKISTPRYHYQHCRIPIMELYHTPRRFEFKSERDPSPNYSTSYEVLGINPTSVLWKHKLIIARSRTTFPHPGWCYHFLICEINMCLL